MFEQMIFEGMDDATSSPVSADGSGHWSLRDGRRRGRSGRGRVPASPSVALEKGKVKPTNDTCGPSSFASSVSAVLQSSLASRLRVRLGAIGSLEYVVTWKDWTMPSGPPICALRARVRKPKDGVFMAIFPRVESPDGSGYGLGRLISGNGCSGSPCGLTVSGHPTPGASDCNRGPEDPEVRAARNCTGRNLVQTSSLVLQGWSTCTAKDGVRGQEPPREWDTGVPLSQQAVLVMDNGQLTMDNGVVALLQGYPTANAGPQNDNDSTWEERRELLKEKHGNGNGNGFGMTLGQCVSLAGYPTANVPNGGRTAPSMSSTGVMPDGTKRQAGLEHVCKMVSPGGLESFQSLLAGFSTPASRDWKDSAGMATEGVNPDGSIRRRVDQLPRQVAMVGFNTPRAPDGSNGGPNPANGALPADVALVSGEILTSSRSGTGKRGGLNAAHSRWLMGYKGTWCQAAIRAYRKCRPRRKGG